MSRSVWIVIADGTSYGDYENAADACLFDTEEEAVSHVERSLREDVVNGVALETGMTDEQLEKEVQEKCKWYGNHETQFRSGHGAITDYRIEKFLLKDTR